MSRGQLEKSPKYTHDSIALYSRKTKCHQHWKFPPQDQEEGLPSQVLQTVGTLPKRIRRKWL